MSWPRWFLLDRFSLVYPQPPAARSGRFDGAWAQTVTAGIADMGSPVARLDVTPGRTVAWLDGFETTASSIRLRAQANHRYLAVSNTGILKPRVIAPLVSSLRSTSNQADYILIAPKAFMEALKKSGVDTTDVVKVRGKRTSFIIMISDRNHNQIGFVDQGAILAQDGIPLQLHTIQRSDVIHVGTGRPKYALQVCKRAAKEGKLVAFDPAQEIHYFTTRARSRRSSGSQTSSSATNPSSNLKNCIN